VVPEFLRPLQREVSGVFAGTGFSADNHPMDTLEVAPILFQGADMEKVGAPIFMKI
jgi:hypothetical protein